MAASVKKKQYDIAYAKTHLKRVPLDLRLDKYNEIKSLIVDASDDDNQVKVIEKENQIKMILMSKNDDEFRNLFKSYSELFEKIDNLID